MRRLKRNIGFIAAAVVAALILAQPALCVNAAREAMSLWAASVAPALFPFLVLMPYLTGEAACAAYEKCFAPVMRVFRLDGSAAPAVAIGMIAGSPAGAIAARRIAAQTRMDVGRFSRLAPAVCGVSPAFLIGIGGTLFGDTAVGVRLAIAQAASQLILLFLLRFCTDDDPRPVGDARAARGGSVASAVAAALTVCGYMVVFTVISAIIVKIAGTRVGGVFLMITDIVGGLRLLSESAMPMRDFLLGAAVGLSGLCVCFQNADILRGSGVKFGRILLVKCMSACLCAMLYPLLPELRMRVAANPYAASMLIALLLGVPCLIYVTMPYFINKAVRR